MRYLTVILALLPSLATAQAEPLGRLFFTPEGRAFLDRERLKAAMPATVTAEAAPPLESVTLNGHIKRSGGKSTVWLNGRPQYESDAARQITVMEKRRAPGEIAVKLPDSDRTYPLKVGQTLTPASGEIREGYQAADTLTATKK